jgi:DNA-binding NtrC family response regulator
LRYYIDMGRENIMINKLLVIDEEPFDREITRKIFSGKYEMAFTANIKELEPVCIFFQPDVILYEMRQKDIDELASVLIKTRLQKYSPPLVIVISENSFELEKAARSYGAFYCLIRPFNLKELWDALEAAFTYSASKKTGINEPSYHIAGCN